MGSKSYPRISPRFSSRSSVPAWRIHHHGLKTSMSTHPSGANQSSAIRRSSRRLSASVPMPKLSQWQIRSNGSGKSSTLRLKYFWSKIGPAEKRRRERMRGPKPNPLTLSEKEQNELEVLVRRHNTPQQVALRGRMILAAAEGKNNSQIARTLGVSVDTVRSWRMRWIGLQAVLLEELEVSERLTDIQRPGRPSEITAEQIGRLVALACEQPKEPPTTHWTDPAIPPELIPP